MTRGKTMGSWWKQLMMAGWVFAATGCAGSVTPTASDAQAVRMESLPDLPGCDARGLSRGAALTARPLAGVHDLFVIYSDGQPLCVDTMERAARALGGFVTLDPATSNPMPGHNDKASSNPMPGNPGDPASSNPMPGEPGDPGGSNPMPGKDKIVAARWSNG